MSEKASFPTAAQIKRAVHAFRTAGLVVGKVDISPGSIVITHGPVASDCRLDHDTFARWEHRL